MPTAESTPAPASPATPARPGPAARAAAPKALTRVVALAGGGEGIRVLTLRAAGAPGRFSLERAETIAPAALGAALARLKPEGVVGVIPAAQVVARAVKGAPAAGDAAAVAGAMELVAEAHAPPGLEPHRRAAGLLPGAPAGAGLLVAGWVGPPPAWSAGLAVEGLRWLPEPAALGALLPLVGRSGPGLTLLADAASGAITLLGRGPGAEPTVLARVLREDGSDPAEWRRAVEEAHADGLAALELPPDPHPDLAERPSDPLTLLLPERDAPASVDGLPHEPAWLAAYGPALGAAAFALGAPPAAAPLLSMSALAPTRRKNPAQAVLAWLAPPRRAIAVVAACLALLLLGPVAFAYARLELLRSQAAALPADSGDLSAAAAQSEYYDLLRIRRWPMTKLLGDLLASAPAGVTVDTVTLEHGRPLEVGGVASNIDAVAQWRTALGASRVFAEVATPLIEGGTSPMRFELRAAVAQPTLAGVSPLSGGPVAAAAPTPDGPDRPAATGSARREPRNADRTDRTDRTERAERSDRTERRPAAATPTASTLPPEPPAPLSDEQIAALSSSKAMVEWAQRRAFSVRPGLDPAVKARLEEEVAKLQRRRREAGGAQ